ncbi:AcrR family transcriptional regulator [Paenibacillus jamilae]|uniref:TetR/AcrR family transcriptional regulator n=1 Tax=Paenibacillus TaxID=44249 RepID=UPI00036E90AA|nr:MULTISPECIES: TetR/AcrR family transcriptional regulator [Paenibacillus]KAE8558782.1 TetR family transcriptional regulator [Paenibacillus polymyxa]KAF6621623.1 WHG domain-containing protein [Paenibacillus sp. EKM101P]KAF6622700.1 WHG domain-containing protein [Paenibacillus sp. EKM102P]KAF6632549.1 WHG domain-containing protein [Paenibacillus sp. EKM10P]KAF6647304.1 WHG domain-containing protein [Paenibacillus sp. EKM11P]
MSPRHGVKLQDILKAAEDIANERGMGDVTLTTLAQKLHIRPPSLYNHVDGLNGLRHVLALHSLEKLEEALVSAAVGRAGEDALTAMGRAYMQYARERPGLYEAMLYATDRNDTELRHAADRVAELVITVLSSGYGFNEADCIHAARGFRSLLHGFASLEQKGGFGLPVDVDRSIEVMMDTFWAGLRVLQHKRDVEHSEKN